MDQEGTHPNTSNHHGEPQRQEQAAVGARHPPSPLTGFSLPVDRTWKPGQSGNPGGRPKGSSVLAPFLRKLAERQNEHGEGEGARRLAQVLEERLLSGDSCADLIKMLDRTDGALKQQIEHSGASIPPLRIEASSAGELARIERLAGVKAQLPAGSVQGSQSGSRPVTEGENHEPLTSPTVPSPTMENTGIQERLDEGYE